MSDFLGKSRIANAAAIKTNVGSFGTRIRYWNAFDRFCLFVKKSSTVRRFRTYQQNTSMLMLKN